MIIIANQNFKMDIRAFFSKSAMLFLVIGTLLVGTISTVIQKFLYQTTVMYSFIKCFSMWLIMIYSSGCWRLWRTKISEALRTNLVHVLGRVSLPSYVQDQVSCKYGVTFWSDVRARWNSKPYKVIFCLNYVASNIFCN